MRWLLCLALGALMLGTVTPAPADDPEVPERFIKVDEVKARLDQKPPLALIDVRPKKQYDAVHIRGALSIPLSEMPLRLAEVPRKGAVVLY